ncbi:hypothetical protein D3C87_1203690 [compost metagenome]
MPVPVVSAFLTAVRLPSTLPTGVPVALTRCTSLRSRSLKPMTPLSLSVPTGATCSLTAPTGSWAVITGPSLLPVMVMVTVASPVPPSASFTS